MNEMDNNSWRTAITRKTVSAPLRAIFKCYRGEVPTSRAVGARLWLDFGCGKGTDADYMGIAKFDPHYFPDCSVLVRHHYQVVFCTYVLNTISEEQQKVVLMGIANLLAYEHSKAYITVRRDIPEEEMTTQRWVELPFKILTKTKGFCIYESSRTEIEELCRIQS